MLSPPELLSLLSPLPDLPLPLLLAVVLLELSRFFLSRMTDVDDVESIMTHPIHQLVYLNDRRQRSMNNKLFWMTQLY